MYWDDWVKEFTPCTKIYLLVKKFTYIHRNTKRRVVDHGDILRPATPERAALPLCIHSPTTIL